MTKTGFIQRYRNLEYLQMVNDN